MRFRQVFVVGAVTLHQIGDGIQPQPVHAHGQPHAHDLEDFLKHARVVKVKVGLMAVEAMPVIGACNRVP